MAVNESLAARRKARRLAWDEELVRRLDAVGTSVPRFLDQVEAFLLAAVPAHDEEVLV